jgi:hypothetical protein
MLVAVAVTVTTAPSVAQDRELSEANDFRVRVQAALRLGRSGGPQARADLEKGLRDPHPAVRVACAVALGNIGDAASIAPLEQAMKGESFASVKSAMRESIDKIRAGKGGGDSGAGAVDVEKAKYVVQLGAMRNNSGVRPDIENMMRQAARAKAGSIKDAVVADASDTHVMKRAVEKRIPVLLVDGSLTKLTETRGRDGGVIVTARVDLSVRKVPQQTLTGTVSGNASASDDARSSQRGIAELQDRAVNGAVASAITSMGTEIASLAR